MSSYQIYQFDGVALPLYNPEQDLSTGGVDSTLLASVGGTFDVWSGWRRLPRIVRHTVSGIYAAPDGTAYIVDHAGNQIVDHAGNAIIAGTAQALLRGQVDAIRAELGFVGPLWRRRWDDPAVAQWKAARLVAVQEKSDIKHRTIAAKLDCVFESAQAAWRDASIDTVSGSLVANGQVALALESSGTAQIDDSTITVTAAGTITSLRFEILHLGIDLRYTGTLPVGAVLQIDCGTQAVTVNGAAAYSGFALGSGHTARGWMPLPPGMWPLQVASNGAGTVSSSHYDQWV
jgi:hypothetical protein